MKIELEYEYKEAIMKQIEIDIRLFQQLEINDYSVLLGVYHLEGGDNEGGILLQ